MDDRLATPDANEAPHQGVTLGDVFRRVPLVHAADLDALERLLEGVGAAVTLIFDADNTLGPQGVPVDVFQRDVTAAIHRFDALDAVDRVIVLTNGPERGVPGMIHRGNKPWTTRRRLGLRRSTEVWVVGDQVLTDGILAWRFGATFVHLAIDTEREAPRQTVMRRIGRWIRRLLFVT